MKWQLFLAIASTVQTAAALEQIGEPEYVDGAWCYTYLSTYLAPVQAETAEPVFPTAPNFQTTRGILPPYFTNRSTALEATESLEPIRNPTSGIGLFSSSGLATLTDGQRPEPTKPGSTTEPGSLLPPTIATSIQASAASTTSSAAQVSGQAVIFLIEPRAADEKRDLIGRDLGGFVVGDAGNAKICTFATTFSLAAGELLDGGSPIYYSSGDTFKQLGSEGTPPDGAITTEFSISEGTLAFVNEDLPNSQADFCQDPDSGQVFITFGESPAGCVPILLRVFEVERCQDGRIVGLDSSSTVGSQPSQSTQDAKPMTSTAETLSSSNSQELFPTDNAGSSALTNLPESIGTSFVTIETTQSIDDTASTTAATSGDLSMTFPSFSSLSLTTEYSTAFILPTTTSIPSQSLSSSLSSYSMIISSELSTSTSISTELSSSFSSMDSASSSETAGYTTVSTLPTISSTETESASAEATSTSDESASVSTEAASTSDEFTSTTADITTTTTADLTTTTVESTTTTGCNSVDPLTTVALANPTPVFDDNLDHVDESVAIVLPFPVGGDTTVYVSSNGVISLGAGVDQFNNDALPSDNLPAIAFAPYWDDLYFSRSRGHTIVYEVFNGLYGNEVTFEFLVGKFIDNGLFHFEASFLESQPDAVRFQYYTTPEKGSSATVGIQNRNTGKSILVEYNQADSIPDGTSIIMSSESGNQVDLTFDNSECGKGGDRI